MDALTDVQPDIVHSPVSSAKYDPLPLGNPHSVDRGGREYMLSIEYAGYRPRELRMDSSADPNVGTIVMEPAG